MADEQGSGDRVIVTAETYFREEAERFKRLAFQFDNGHGSIDSAVVELLRSHAEVLSILSQLATGEGHTL